MKDRLNILLVDDDEDEYFLLKDLIARAPAEGVLQQFTLEWVSDFEQGAAALKQCSYDIYLVDYHLGNRSGLDLLRTAASAECKSPIILLTGHGHFDIDMAAMQLGAYDYMVKGEMTLSLLERSIRYALERKQHEEILRRSEWDLKKAQNVAKMGSWTWYISEDRIEVSEEMYRLFGIDSVARGNHSWKLGDMVERYIHPEDRSRVYDAFHKVQKTGKPLGLEYRVVWPDGTIRVVWAEHAEQVRDGEGNAAVMTGIIQDITDRKKMEKALIESEKLAGLGTLAAGMAHEINTPLQVITGASESIQRKLNAETTIELGELERRISHINANAWRIASIVRSLLDYARSSAEEMVECSLNDIVAATLPLTEQQFLNWSNVTISTRLTPNLPMAACDPNKMIQVLVNLLNNARDAMTDGGHIMVETALDEPGNHVLLRVIDSGSGISNAIQNRIFDPFFTSKPPGKGIGLGLSISTGIIQAAGGKLELEKSSSEGSAFKLTLPVSRLVRE